MKLPFNKSIVKYFSCFSVILMIIGIFACKKTDENKENFLAVVGEKKITLEEFHLFYELDPNFGIDSTGINALRDELKKYIDRYVAKEKAEKDNLWEDPIYKKALDWEINQIQLRQLYREVVETPIRISEEEIREEFIKQSIQVNIRHLYSDNLDQATEWYKALQRGESFEYLAAESFTDTLLANNGGDLGWLSLSDFDDNLAREISFLSANEISKPAKSKWGYHVIQLLDRNDQVIINEDDLNREKISIERRIKQKKQRELSSRFIKSYLGRINPQPDPAIFRQLLHVLVPVNEREKKDYDHKITFTGFYINKAENQLANSLEEPLVKYSGGYITLVEYLNSLKRMPVGNRPRFQNARQFSNQIGIWVRDKLLLQKAEEYNFLENEQVLAEIDDFQAEQSYYYYLNIELEQITVPEKINQYFESKYRSEFVKIHRKLSHFHTLQEWKWWEAERRLQQNLKKDSPAIWINDIKLKEENAHIDWHNRIRMFMVRKPS